MKRVFRAFFKSKKSGVGGGKREQEEKQKRCTQRKNSKMNSTAPSQKILLPLSDASRRHE